MSAIAASSMRVAAQLLLIAAASAGKLYGSACIDASGNVIVNTSSVAPPAPVTSCPTVSDGWFDDVVSSTGWSFIELHSTPGMIDEDQAYVMGYLEGFLTQPRVLQSVLNTQGGNGTGFGPKLTTFLSKNDAWVRNMSAPYGGMTSGPVSLVRGAAPARSGSGDSNATYWHQVWLTLRQQDGLYDGYAAAAGAAGFLSRDVFDTATLQGDLIDLCSIYTCNVGKPSSRITSSHCSVLVKPVADGNGGWADVWMGHTTWSGFETMLRLYKHIDMPVTLDGTASSGIVPGRHVMLSGYPGNIVSLDDWYVLQPSGLIVTETTITNVNASLWSHVTHKSVLEWVRNVVANRLATDGASWMDTFAVHNSGTYNNAWHVLNTGVFTPGQAGYWGSYNVPYFPVIFEVSGYQKLVDKYGEYYSWANTSRARIFNRLQGGVVDELSYRAVMRHNEYETDVEGTEACTGGVRSASNAISERGDLTPKDSHKYCLSDVERQDEAGIDLKYTSIAMLAKGNGTCMAQSGPTYDSQPPFAFSTSPFASLSHAGMPDAWQFPYVAVSWQL